MEAERLIAVLATFAVGAIVALQPPVNSELGKQTTVLVAAFVGTAIAAAALGLLVVFAGEVSAIGKVGGVNPLYLTGGLMGALLITVSLVTVRTLGAGGVVAATLCGQLVISAVLDRVGAIGLEAVALTPERILGFVLLIAGTLLVVLR
jgi:transporter family-2 protein